MPKENLIEYRPYERMARYYDMIYHQLVDYEADCDFIQAIFRKHSKGPVKSILDIGCGTGNHAFILGKRRYQVIGIDKSKEMVSFASRKAKPSAKNPAFYEMDMRKIKLNKKFDAALAMFGGFGYLLEDSDVRSFLASVGRHLNEGGLLVYEFWHNSAVNPASSKPSGYIAWDRMEDKRSNQLLIRLNRGEHDAQTNFLTINFDFYVIDTKQKRVSDMFSETHVTRTYSIPEMRRLLEDNGITPLAFYIGELNEKVLKPASLSTFRVMCVASL